MKPETKDTVNEKIWTLRAHLEKDKAEKVQDGKRRAQKAGQTKEAEADKEAQAGEDSKAGGASQERRVRFWDVPEEFKVDYTKEEDLQHVVREPGDEWGKTVHEPAQTNGGRDGDSAPQEARRLVAEAQRLGKHATLQALEGASDDLFSWAAARVARDETLDTASLLNEMATYGLGELAKEAAEILENLEGHRAGSGHFEVHATQWDGEGPGHGAVPIEGHKWSLWDYKEEIPMTEELASMLQVPHAGVEKRQCVTLTLAAGLLRHKEGSLPTVQAAVQEAQSLRLEQTRQACEATRTIGEPSEVVTAVEHETRIYIHDLITAHHEKDFRSLAVFPLEELADCRLVVLRADYQGHLVVEGITGP